MTEERTPRTRYPESYHDELVDRVLNRGHGEVARKTARILAVSVPHDFVVETDRGPMEGAPGDWLVTNHPDDDPGSDVWAISDARFQATYALDDSPRGRITQRGDVERANALGEVAGEPVPYVDASPDATGDRPL